MSKSFLIIGIDGKISQELNRQLIKKGTQIIGTTRKIQINESNTLIALDLSTEQPTFNCPDNIESAFFGIAETRLSECSVFPEKTSHINVTNTIKIIKKIVDKNGFVIFPSTNLVFDGILSNCSPETLVNPKTEYGRQKAIVEKELLSWGSKIAIIRFSKILSPETPLFHSWIRDLQKNKKIYPFYDMVMAPIPISFAGEVIMRVADDKATGIIQVSGIRDITYADAARYIADRMGCNADLIHPISCHSANPVLEHAPLHTTLDTSRLQQEFGLTPPDVWATLDSAFG